MEGFSFQGVAHGPDEREGRRVRRPCDHRSGDRRHRDEPDEHIGNYSIALWQLCEAKHHVQI
jgi:hypothetical protein